VSHRLWYNFEIILRIVRATGADRPQFILEIHQRPMSLVQTVKYTADRPQHIS